MINDFEHQRLEMEHLHAQKLHKVLESANQRVTKMDAEYRAQSQSSVSTLDFNLFLASVIDMLN